MAGVAGEEFRDDTKTVEVRGKAGAYYDGLFAAVQRRGAGDEPTSEQMSHGAHGARTWRVRSLCKKNLPLMTQIGLICTDKAGGSFLIEKTAQGRKTGFMSFRGPKSLSDRQECLRLRIEFFSFSHHFWQGRIRSRSGLRETAAEPILHPRVDRFVSRCVCCCAGSG